MGHPCDKYLYLAHKFIDGIPKFKKRSKVLSKSSTYTQAKQTKTTPGHDSTRHDMYLGQDLSTDSIFSGATSQIKENEKIMLVLIEKFVGS